MAEQLSLELILHDDIQHLLDNFAAVVKARVVFFSSDGRVLKRGRGEGNCRYCQLIQQHFSVERCLKLDHEKQALAAQSHSCQAYFCHAQLWEAVMPIWSGPLLLGFVVFGQCRTGNELSEELLHNFPAAEREQLQAEFLKLPCLSAEELQNLTGLMHLLVDYIVRSELVRLGGDYIYRELIDYIDRNLVSDLKITEVARHLGRSPSALSHFLKAHGYDSFKKIVINKRLQRAEELLKTRPTITVKEVADACGFADSYYFSRLFHKYRQLSPSEFRQGRGFLPERKM